MLDFKKEIAVQIAKQTDLNENEIYGYIEVPKNVDNGDYAFPCFNLAKTMKKAPQAIAEELKEKLQFDNGVIERVEVAGGYINFSVNQNKFIFETFNHLNNGLPSKSHIGEGNTVLVEYSSPNLAKPFPIG
ncbi:MAG: arginine--tRNA ligase, partial [Clostridia bacterium]|nr:arginine--tRNA ligase [Clostridia bacterium]